VLENRCIHAQIKMHCSSAPFAQKTHTLTGTRDTPIIPAIQWGIHAYIAANVHRRASRLSLSTECCWHFIMMRRTANSYYYCCLLPRPGRTHTYGWKFPAASSHASLVS
jgi:hypothetical protein